MLLLLLQALWHLTLSICLSPACISNEWTCLAPEAWPKRRLCSPNFVPFYPLRNPEAVTAPAEVARLPQDPRVGAEQGWCDRYSLQLQLWEVMGTEHSLPPFIYLCIFKYLFIYLAAPGLSCGTWDLHCGMRDLLVVACELFSCSMWDLVPWPGIEPGPPALGAWSLSHWTTREVLGAFTSAQAERLVEIEDSALSSVARGLYQVTQILRCWSHWGWNPSWDFSVLICEMGIILPSS